MKIKTPKLYAGDISFDMDGNMLTHTPWGGIRLNLTADMISGDRVLTDKYDYLTNTRNKTASFYTLAELNFVEHPQPVPAPYGNDIYVGECDQYYTVKNFIFDDELKYTGFYRGQSSAGLEFKSTLTGKEYAVFLTDFTDYVNDMVFGVVKGKFTFCKRGTKYGLRLLK
jgi:hypothetical protein